MKICALCLLAFAVVALNTGCIALPTDLLSSFILQPDVSCSQLAWNLSLGDFPSVSSPAALGLEFESVTFDSANRRELSAWFIPAQQEGQLDPDPAGTVLIMHGTHGPIACTLPWALVATANHMHALVFDYQGFGDSEGTADIGTLLNDSEAALDWILSDDSAARQNVHLVGLSLGTSPAMGLGVLRPRAQIQSITVDGAFDVEQMLETSAGQLGGLFPWFNFSARIGCRWLFETRSRLNELTTPFMMIQAENDLTTPTSGAEAIYNLVGSVNKSYWLFEGMTHAQPLFLAEEEYVSLLVTFWRNPTQEPSPAASKTDDTIRVPSFAL